MKKETTNFILGILLGLLLASFFNHSATQWKALTTDLLSFTNKLFPIAVFASAAASDAAKREDSIEQTFLATSTDQVRSNLIQNRPNDPRLSFLKRKSGSEAATLKDKGSVSTLKQMSEEKTALTKSSVTMSPQPHGNATAKDEEGGFANKRSKCASLFGERTYLKEAHKKLPPLLYTFPGSGNTWCRLLVEYATGIYTGSVYNDESLLSALPGEFTCNWQVSAVKAHPHTHRASELYSGQYNSDNNKCKRGNIQRFERSILLIRDPYDSIWSEYQRRVSQSHVKGVLKDGFDWHRWQANAANLAHAYLDMWTLDHDLIERQSTHSDYLYIKYEDLKNKAVRVSALQKIVEFLRLPTTQSANQKQLLKRLECAFVLAENREAHRSIDKTLYMTKDIAYKEEIACRMWSLFSSYASKYGYHPWNHFNCTGYPKIPRINVGPQGDYDHRWIRPGQKLIDFRGKLFRNNTLITNPSKPVEDNPVPAVVNRNQNRFPAKRQKQPFGNPNLKAVVNAPQPNKEDGTFEEVEKMVLKKSSNNARRNRGKRIGDQNPDSKPITASKLRG